MPDEANPSKKSTDPLIDNRQLQSEVLRLQQKVYTDSVALMTSLAETIKNFNTMISEGRLAIFEHRLALRGGSLSGVELKAPAGSEGLFE